jgi:starch-binding outer membrane protein, SusD/RagB family
MKNIFKSVLIATCVLLTQCDSQLDLKPLGQLDETTYYKNEKDFEAASLSTYSTLLNFTYNQDASGWYNAVFFPDDDTQPGNNANNNREDFVWTADDGDFFIIWRESYRGIQRANVILKKLPEAEGFTDEANKTRFEAEAKFLRAYFHFLLAINFGNAPVSRAYVGTLEATQMPNSAPGEIWDFIIEDLQFAQTNLPEAYEGINIGRVTSGAATALLGKTYLYRAQWANNTAFYNNAVTEFSKLTGKYSLLPNFGDNFALTKENGAESIFEIQFTRGDFNTWLPTDFALYEDQNIGYAGSARTVVQRPSCFNGNCAPGATSQAYGSMDVTSSLQNAFEPNDPRRPETIYLDGDFFYDGQNFSSGWAATGSTPAKYIKQDDLAPAFPPNFTVNNERVIRYGDVLLMLAEAKLLGSDDVAGAAELINEVRRRADPAGDFLPDRSAAVTKDEMFDFLMHERRVELALEGHRYFDLVRWHRAGLIDIETDVDFGKAAPNNNWQEKHLIKPIPQRELDLNPNLVQNDEYLGGG